MSVIIEKRLNMNSILLNPILAHWFEFDIKPLLPNHKPIASSLSLDIVVLMYSVLLFVIGNSNASKKP